MRRKGIETIAGKYLLVLLLCFLTGTGMVLAEDEEGVEEELGTTISLQEFSQESITDNDLKPEVKSFLVEPTTIFSVEDVELSQGVVNRNETDLMLPGYPGLDLVINRVYNSSDYRSAANLMMITSKNIGEGMGSGWRINCVSKAFFSEGVELITVYKSKLGSSKKVPVVTKTFHEKFVVIDLGGNQDTYWHNSKSGYFFSKNPENKNVVKLMQDASGVRQIVLLSGGGLKYIFSEKFIDETLKKQGITKEILGENPSRITERNLISVGFYLKKIESIFNSKTIQFEYEKVALGDSGTVITQKKEKGKIPTQGVSNQLSKIMNDYFNNYFSGPEWTTEINRKQVMYRLKTIVDSYSRRVEFGYIEPWNLNQDSIEKQFQITSLKYQNVNNGLNTIKYGYNVKGLLSSVQLNNLPQTEYAYQDYEPTYQWITFQEKQGSYEDYYLEPAYPDQKLPFFQGEGKISVHKKEDNLKRIMRGTLLTKVKTALGSEIIYSYKDCLVVDSKTIKVSQKGGGHDRYYLKYLNGGNSFPVVVEKSVKASNESFTTQFKYWGSDKFYPSSKVRYEKTKFTPSWDNSVSSYYFPTVNVVQKEGFVLPIRYEFDKARLSRTVQGINETRTIWREKDGFVQKTKEETYKSGVLQNQTEYLSYDRYNNVKEIKSNRMERMMSFAEIGLPTMKQKPLFLKTITYLHEVINPPESYVGKTDNEILFAIASIRIPVETKTRDLVDTGRYFGEMQEFNTKIQQLATYKKMSESDEYTLMTSLQYDADGRVSLKKILSPQNGYLQLAYNYELRNGRETVTEIQNGKSSKLQREINTGKILEVTDWNGAKTSLEFDDIGRITSQVNADGYRKSWGYSTDLKSETEVQDGLSLVKTYDELGRIMSINRPAGMEDTSYQYYFSNLPDLVKQGVIATTIKYDKYLRKIEETNSQTGKLTFEYENGGNQIITTDALGRRKTILLNTIGQTEALHEQGVPNQDERRSFSTSYDGLGATIIQYSPRGSSVRAEYYGDGAVKNIYYSGSKVEKKYANQYYLNGQLKEVRVGGNAGPSRLGGGMKFEYTYDIEGRIKSLKFNGVEKEICSYDDHNRQNGIGQLTSINGEGSSSVFDYDKMGRMISEKKVNKHTNQTTKLDHGFMVFGGLKTMSLKDDVGQTQYEVSYSYDSLKRVTEIRYKNQVIAQYTYKSDGKLDTTTYGNGIQFKRAYTSQGRLDNTTILKSNNQLNSKKYGYDGVGTLTDTSGTDAFENVKLTKQYKYTGHNELKAVQKNTKLLYELGYDNGGNIAKLNSLKEKNVANQFLTNEENQLIVSTFQGEGTQEYSYDVAGNMVRRVYKGINGQITKTITYVYNYQNQPVEIKENGTTIALYGYDTSKQRIYKKLPKTGEERVYNWDSSGHVIAEGTKLNPFEVQYVYSGNEKIAMIQKGQTYYFINNLQGTTEQIVDSSGKVVQKIELDEWGRVERSEGTLSHEINYTGKKLDQETGLYYFNQRYYDPTIGRFLAEDSARQGLNPYAYCGNNPTMYIDPDGEWFWAAFAVAAKMAAYSAAINATAQLVMTGHINAQNVGTAALRGGAMGFIGFAAGQMFGALEMGSGVMANIAEAGIQKGLESVTYSWISGKEMSQNEIFKNFGQSAIEGSIAGALKEGYKKVVGFKMNYAPGKGVANKATLENPTGRGVAVEFVNNIGFLKDPLVKYGNDLFREGGALSTVMNQIPAMNAVGGLHDVMGKWDMWYGQFSTFAAAGVAASYVYSTYYMDNAYLFR